MWYRLFIASNVAFFLGIFTFFFGEFLIPQVASFTLPAGALVSGAAGLVGGVSGIALIMVPGNRA